MIQRFTRNIWRMTKIQTIKWLCAWCKWSWISLELGKNRHFFPFIFVWLLYIYYSAIINSFLFAEIHRSTAIHFSSQSNPVMKFSFKISQTDRKPVSWLIFYNKLTMMYGKKLRKFSENWKSFPKTISSFVMLRPVIESDFQKSKVKNKSNFF